MSERLPDRWGVKLPDGTVVDCTRSAHLFGVDAHDQARLVAEKNGGCVIRFVTIVEESDG